MDASRHVPPDPASATRYIPLHPHNFLLQTGLELGLPGIALLLFIIGAIFWRCLDQPPERRTAFCGFFLSALVIFSLSYGEWQGWWLSTVWLCTALLLATPAPNAPTQER